MTERERLNQSTLEMQIGILRGKSSHYINKDWDNWLFGQKEKWLKYSMRMPIAEYMKTFGKHDPFWLETFSLRNFKKETITENPETYFEHSTGEGENKKYLERELIQVNGDLFFGVERTLDQNRNCKKLIILFPEEKESFRFRQEERVSLGRSSGWCVINKGVFTSINSALTDRNLFHSPKSWEVLFPR